MSSSFAQLSGLITERGVLLTWSNEKPQTREAPFAPHRTAPRTLQNRVALDAGPEKIRNMDNSGE